MDTQLKKGLLEIGVLATLKNEESYGYKIITDLSPVLDISESTLYPILRRLESAKYIEARDAIYNGRLRRYFKITNNGKLKLFDYLDDLKQMKKIADFIATKVF